MEIQPQQGHSAQEVQNALLAAVHQFVGKALQFDDMTLLIVARNG
jgi:serine phosphatase RsbU (regulator of sigma subunit)